jgi:DNA-binding response OmpR family regulator
MSEKIPPAGDGEQVGAVAAAPLHVLLVEDEELVAMTMVDELRSRGWEVVGPVGTLEEAQALVAEGVHLDAAILDINLRGRWVHSLAVELTERGVPFVVCTGYEIVDPDGRLARAPLIAKPIAPHQLGATLDDLVNRASAAEPPLEPS